MSMSLEKGATSSQTEENWMRATYSSLQFSSIYNINSAWEKCIKYIKLHYLLEKYYDKESKCDVSPCYMCDRKI